MWYSKFSYKRFVCIIKTMNNFEISKICTFAKDLLIKLKQWITLKFQKFEADVKCLLYETL